MTAHALDVYLEPVGARHAGTRNETDPSCGDVRPDVHREAGVDALERPLGDHGECALTRLLCRLEGEPDNAAPFLPRLLQHECGGEQHRRVAVVSAGVHDAGIAACERGSRGLGDGKRIHVGTKKNGPAGLRAPDLGKRARLKPAGPPFDARLRELLPNEGCGFKLAAAQLGMSVNAAAHADQEVRLAANNRCEVHVACPFVRIWSHGPLVGPRMRRSYAMDASVRRSRMGARDIKKGTRLDGSLFL